MGGGGVFQKPDSGFGAGVRPTAGLMNSRDNLISQGRARAEPPASPHMEGLSGFRNPGNLYNETDVSEAQGIHDRAEERRQEKLDAMAGMAGGKGEGSQAPRPPGQGQPGQFQVKSTPMVELKRRFPSLEQTEGSLNPFLGRRY